MIRRDREKYMKRQKYKTTVFLRTWQKVLRIQVTKGKESPIYLVFRKLLELPSI
jgi:hypothetical protein